MRTLPILLLAAGALGLSRPALAERIQQLAYVAEPPPPPPVEVPREVAIAAVSSAELAVADGAGGLTSFARGVGLSLHWLQLRDDFPTGFEAAAVFGFGDDGARLYDLGISIVGSFEIRRRLAVPFASLGLDLAAVRVPNPDGEPTGGVTLGVHGNVGLHGFLTDSLYWRGQVGYLGAGVGGLKGELMLGYAFGD